MNKEYYKRTFSKVRPSEKALERIFDMTEKKPKRIRFKGLIAAAVIIALLLCGTLSANAATDGKLYTGVKGLATADEIWLAEKVNDDDTFLNRIIIKINGEEISLDNYITVECKVVISGAPDEDDEFTYNIKLVTESENWDEIVNAEN